MAKTMTLDEFTIEYQKYLQEVENAKLRNCAETSPKGFENKTCCNAHRKLAQRSSELLEIATNLTPQEIMETRTSARGFGSVLSPSWWDVMGNPGMEKLQVVKITKSLPDWKTTITCEICGNTVEVARTDLYVSRISKTKDVCTNCPNCDAEITLGKFSSKTWGQLPAKTDSDL